jgi:hypothetical protein
MIVILILIHPHNKFLNDGEHHQNFLEGEEFPHTQNVPLPPPFMPISKNMNT